MPSGTGHSRLQDKPEEDTAQPWKAHFLESNSHPGGLLQLLPAAPASALPSPTPSPAHQLRLPRAPHKQFGGAGHRLTPRGETSAPSPGNDGLIYIIGLLR